MRAHDIKIDRDRFKYFRRVLEGFPEDDPELIKPYLTRRRLIVPVHKKSVDFFLDLMLDLCNSFFMDHPFDARLLEIEEARYGRMVRLIISRTWKCPEIGHVFGEPAKRGRKKKYKTKKKR
jgi:hypothetical protein